MTFLGQKYQRLQEQEFKNLQELTDEEFIDKMQYFNGKNLLT